MLDPIKNAFTIAGLRALIAKIKGSLSTKLDMTDVVSSWQSTPDNAHVPTEKLVKDTIDNMPPGTRVKGDAESEYRTGNVNLTPANIGAYSKSESDSALANKADKVAGANEGYFAGLDSNGNLTDSGYRPSSFAKWQQGEKADSAIQGVSVNGTALTPDANKKVDVAVPTASTTTPSMNGTASVGSDNHWAKGDHVHPTDTSREAVANKKQSINDSSTTDYPSSAAVASFVNSSVATNTANFLGNFTLNDLGLSYGATNVQIAAALNSHNWPSGVTPTNNDYVYVEIQNPQTTGVDDKVERFKFRSLLESWGYEYTLNNSSFTAAEVAAIDSGITATDKTNYDNHLANTNNPHGVTKAQVGLGSVVNTGDSATPVSGGTTKFTTGGAFTELAKKVDKETGKGLSANDFTDTYKNNVDSNTSARHSHSNKSVLDDISSTDVTNWDGKYVKPSGGIPKTDLASDVQTSLGKADTALQAHQSVVDNNPTLSWGGTSTVGSVGGTSLQVTMPSNPASGKLDTDGDGSNVSVTPDGTSTGYDLGSGTTLKAWAQKFKNLVGSLKALAFKDKVSDGDISGTISDSHIASASTWNGKQDSLGINSSSGDTGKFLNERGAFVTPSYPSVDQNFSNTSSTNAISTNAVYNAMNSAIKYERYFGSTTSFKLCTMGKLTSGSSVANAIELVLRCGNYGYKATMVYKNGFKMYAMTSQGTSVSGTGTRFFWIENNNKIDIYCTSSAYTSVVVKAVVSGSVDFSDIFTTASIPEGATEITPQVVATISDIINNLNSTSTTNALSAAQGKALNDNKRATWAPQYFKKYGVVESGNSTNGWKIVAEIDASSITESYMGLKVDGFLHYNGINWGAGLDGVSIPFSAYFNASGDTCGVSVGWKKGWPSDYVIRIEKVATRHWLLEVQLSADKQYVIECCARSIQTNMLGTISFTQTDLTQAVAPNSGTIINPSVMANDRSTNSLYATKIGQSDSTSQVGSTTIPVYVDPDGQVQPCDPSQMGVASASYAAYAAYAPMQEYDYASIYQYGTWGEANVPVYHVHQLKNHAINRIEVKNLQNTTCNLTIELPDVEQSGATFDFIVEFGWYSNNANFVCGLSVDGCKPVLHFDGSVWYADSAFYSNPQGFKQIVIVRGDTYEVRRVDAT